MKSVVQNKWSINFSANWKECPAGYYCPGDNTQNKCPDGFTSNTGSTAKTNCRITCNKGTYLPGGQEICNECIAGYYCTGGTYYFNGLVYDGVSHHQGIAKCSDTLGSNYQYSATGATKAESCYMQVSWGHYKTSSAGNTQKSCAKGYWNNEHPSYYNSPDQCGECTRINNMDAWTSSGTTANNCGFTCKANYYKHGNSCDECESEYFTSAGNAATSCTKCTYYDWVNQSCVNDQRTATRTIKNGNSTQCTATRKSNNGSCCNSDQIIKTETVSCSISNGNGSTTRTYKYPCKNHTYGNQISSDGTCIVSSCNNGYYINGNGCTKCPDSYPYGGGTSINRCYKAEAGVVTSHSNENGDQCKNTNIVPKPSSCTGKRYYGGSRAPDIGGGVRSCTQGEHTNSSTISTRNCVEQGTSSSSSSQGSSGGGSSSGGGTSGGSTTCHKEPGCKSGCEQAKQSCYNGSNASTCSATYDSCMKSCC